LTHWSPQGGRSGAVTHQAGCIQSPWRRRWWWRWWCGVWRWLGLPPCSWGAHPPHVAVGGAPSGPTTEVKCVLMLCLRGIQAFIAVNKLSHVVMSCRPYGPSLEPMKRNLRFSHDTKSTHSLPFSQKGKRSVALPSRKHQNLNPKLSR